MLFSVSELKKLADIEPTRLLHVGAHKGEERTSYLDNWGNSLQKIIWIEGQTELVAKLESVIDKKLETVLEAIVWSEAGVEKDFFVANNSEASSLLTFDLHATQYPSIQVNITRKVVTTTIELATEEDSNFDFVNFDIQGAELEAIKGMGNRINSIRWIYTEINKRSLYNGAPLLKELQKHLSLKGFKLLGKRWTPGAGWGDAIFVKKNEFKFSSCAKIHLSNLIFYSRQIWFRFSAAVRIRSRLGINRAS